MQLNLIELKDKTVPMEWDINSVVTVVRELCGDDFACGLEDMLIELTDLADYNAQKINTDLGCYEMYIEQIRRDIIDAAENLSELISKIENGEIAFSKQKIMPVIKRIKYELEYSV